MINAEMEANFEWESTPRKYEKMYDIIISITSSELLYFGHAKVVYVFKTEASISYENVVWACTELYELITFIK